MENFIFTQRTRISNDAFEPTTAKNIKIPKKAHDSIKKLFSQKNLKQRTLVYMYQLIFIIFCSSLKKLFYFYILIHSSYHRVQFTHTQTHIQKYNNDMEIKFPNFLDSLFLFFFLSFVEKHKK